MRSEGTVVGSVCVFLSVTLHLTTRMFVRLTVAESTQPPSEDSTHYSLSSTSSGTQFKDVSLGTATPAQNTNDTAYEGQKFRTVFSENAPLRENK